MGNNNVKIKNMEITLKAKHIYYIASLLKSLVAENVFSILNEVRNSITSETLDEDEVIVNITPEQFLFVYPILGEIKERYASVINIEMEQIIMPQVQSGVIAQDSDWLKVYEYILGYKNENDVYVNHQIELGKSFIN